MKSIMKNALNSAIKILYVMPAVLWDMMTLLLIVPLASWQGIFPVFWLYPTLPTVAAVLLWKGKWWGCIPGIAMGVMLMTLVPNEEVSGLRYCLYFAIMGLICCLTSRKRGKNNENTLLLPGCFIRRTDGADRL